MSYANRNRVQASSSSPGAKFLPFERGARVRLAPAFLASIHASRGELEARRGVVTWIDPRPIDGRLFYCNVRWDSPDELCGILSCNITTNGAR